MADRYDEYEDRLLPDGGEEYSDTKYAEEQLSNTADEYYELPNETASRNMIWSIISLVFGILSVVTCQIYVLSMILAVLGMGASLYSRRKLGYFDRPSVIGLIIAIFGLVFAVAAMFISISGIFEAH